MNKSLQIFGLFLDYSPMILGGSLAFGLSLSIMTVGSVVSLPPPDDVPEEVLRTEIITQARSPIDGKPISAAEYAQLKAQLQQPLFPPQVSPKIRQLIFLIRLRHLLHTVTPL